MNHDLHDPAILKQMRVVLVHPDIEADIRRDAERAAQFAGVELRTGHVCLVDDGITFRRAATKLLLAMSAESFPSGPIGLPTPRGAQWKNEPNAYGPPRRRR